MTIAGEKPLDVARSATPVACGTGRRFFSLVYELLLIFAIAFFAALAFPGATDHAIPLSRRLAFQMYLFGIIGVYFVSCWHFGGQTLPMKAWRIRVERITGQRLELWRAILRYALACMSTLALGLGYAWAFFDRDRQFLHDRLAGTRIVRCR
jgi:uncharacterized RDD family membrane protein YckC